MPNLDNEISKSKLDITRLKTKLSQLSSVINSLDLDTVLKELDVLVRNQESIASAAQEPVHNLVVKDRLLDEILNTKEKLDNLIKEYNLLNNTSYTIIDLQKQHHKEVNQKQFIKDYFTSRNKEVLSVDIINNCFKNLAHEEILTLLNVVDNDYANVSLSDFSSAKLDIIRQEIKHILSLLRSKLLTYNKNNHTNYSLYNAPKEVINKFVNTKKNTIYSYLKDENGVFYSQDEVALVWPMLSSAQLESIIAYLGKEYTTNAVINPDVDKRVRDSFYRSIAKLKKLLKEARQNPEELKETNHLTTIYDYFKDENGNLLSPESVDCILDNLTNQAHINAIINYLGTDFKKSSSSQLGYNSKEYTNFYRTVNFLLKKAKKLLNEYNSIYQTNYTLADLGKTNVNILDRIEQKSIYNYFKDENGNPLSKATLDYILDNLASKVNLKNIRNYLGVDFKTASAPQASLHSKEYFNFYKTKIHLIKKAQEILEQYNTNHQTNYALADLTKIPSSYLKKEINSICKQNLKSIYDYFKDENGNPLPEDTVDYIIDNFANEVNLKAITTFLGSDFKTASLPQALSRSNEYYAFFQTKERIIKKAKKILEQYNTNHQTNYTLADLTKIPSSYLKKEQNNTSSKKTDVKQSLKSIYDYFKDENGNLLSKDTVDYILDNLASENNLKNISNFWGVDFKTSSVPQASFRSNEYYAFCQTKYRLMKRTKKFLEQYNATHQTNYTLADLTKIPSSYLKKEQNNTSSKEIHVNQELKSIYDYFKDENSKTLSKDTVDYIIDNFASETNLKNISNYFDPDFQTSVGAQKLSQTKEYSNFFKTKDYLIKKSKKFLEKYNATHSTSYTLVDLTKIPISYLAEENNNSIYNKNRKSIYDYFKDENGNLLSKDTVDYILDNFASETNLKNISNFLGPDFKTPSPLQKKSVGKEYISFKQAIELLQRRATKFVAQYNHINNTSHTLSTISQISTDSQIKSIYNYFKDEKGNLLSTDVVDYILDNFASETNLKNISNYFDPDFQTSVGAQKLSQTKEYSTFHKTKDCLIKKSKKFLEQYNATHHTSYMLVDLTKIPINCPEKENNNTSSKEIHVNQELKSIYDYFKDENSNPLSKDTVDYILDKFASETNLKNISNFLGPDFKTPSLLQKKSTSKEYSVFKQTIVILQRRATKFVAQYNHINSTNYTLSTISQISTYSQIKSIYNYFKDENGNSLSKDTVDYILDNLASEANLKTINNYFDPEFQTPVGPQTVFRSSEYHAFCKTRDRLIKRAKNIIDQYNTTHQTSYTLADLTKILISYPKKENNNTVSKNTDVNKNLKSIYDYFKDENGNLLSKDTVDYILDNLASEANLKNIIILLGPDFKTPSPLQKKSRSKEYSAFQQTIILLRRRATKFLEQYNQINSTNYTLSTISQVSIERQNQSIYDYFKDEKGNLLSKENVDYILANFTIPSNLKSISKYLGADFKTSKKHPKNTHSGQYQAFNQTIFNIIQKVQKFIQYYNQTHQTSYTLSDLTNSSFNSKYLELQTIHSRNINKLSTDEIVSKIKELQFYKNQLLADVEFLNLLKNDSRFNYLAQKVGETQAILTFLHLGYYTNNPLSVKHLASLFDINNYALQQSLKNSLAILKEYYENAQSIVKTKTIGE